MEKIVGISVEILVQMTFIRDPEVVLGIAFLDKAWRKAVVRNPSRLNGKKRDWIPVGICSSCISEEDPPFVRRDWMRSWVESCDRHHRTLDRKCLICDHVFDTRDIDSLLDGNCPKCSANFKYRFDYYRVHPPKDRMLFSKMFLRALNEGSFIWKEEEIFLSECLSREVAFLSRVNFSCLKYSAHVFIFMPMEYRPRGRIEHKIKESVDQGCKQLSLFKSGFEYAAELIDAVLEINPACNGSFNDAYLFMKEHRHKYSSLECLWETADMYRFLADYPSTFH